MSKLTLVGIDPGIVDTAAIAITLDFLRKRVNIVTQVWTNVTLRQHRKITINDGYLDEIRAFVDHSAFENSATFTGIEGYRDRGYNMEQDQAMNAIIQSTQEILPGSLIVDNTGIKKIVTEPMLKMFFCTRFQGTNHADIKSAARVALRVGIGVEAINHLLSDFIKQNLAGDTWELGSILTLE